MEKKKKMKKMKTTPSQMADVYIDEARKRLSDVFEFLLDLA